jgi:hypothetical protein
LAANLRTNPQKAFFFTTLLNKIYHIRRDFKLFLVFLLPYLAVEQIINASFQVFHGKGFLYESINSRAHSLNLRLAIGLGRQQYKWDMTGSSILP